MNYVLTGGRRIFGRLCFLKLHSPLFAVIFLLTGMTVHGATVPISSPKKTIVYPAGASTQLVETANMLKDKLNNITGLTFTTATYDATYAWPANAIILGKSTNLNDTTALPDPFNATTYNAKEREHYHIGASSTNNYIFIIGKSDAAIRHGVYDFLEQLGCRWYFPGAKWTITPSSASLSWTTPASPLSTRTLSVAPNSNVTLNVYNDENPDFKQRFWTMTLSGKADWLQNYNDYQAWARAVRVNGLWPDVTAAGAGPEGLWVFSSNNYGIENPDTKIVKWGKQHLKGDAPNQVPYWSSGFWSDRDPTVGGENRVVNTQFGVSNQGTETGIYDLVTEYVKDFFVQYPKADTVSMETNDGGIDLWCLCPFCQSIQDIDTANSITNRVVHFANKAASVLTAANNLDRKYVAYLAYASHSKVPTTGVNPDTNTTVQFTPAPPERTYVLPAGGSPLLLSQWRALSPLLNLGVYDYLDFFFTSGGLPNTSRVSSLRYVGDYPSLWKASNADAYQAECSMNWGADGLGYYLLSKKLWKTTADATAIKTEFISKCFANGATSGAAFDAMKDFYERIDRNNKYQFSTDLVARLYKDLKAARDATPDIPANAAITNRLDDLTLWVTYCSLYKKYSDTSSYATTKALLKFAWMIRGTNMVDCGGMFQYMGNKFDADFEWPLVNDQTPAVAPYPPSSTPWGALVPAVVGAATHPMKPSYTFTHADIVAMNNGTYVSSVINAPGDTTTLLTLGINTPMLPESPKQFSADLVPSCRAASPYVGNVIYQLNKSNVYMFPDASGNLPGFTIRAGYTTPAPNPSPHGELYATLDTESGIPLEEKVITPGPAPTPPVNTIAFNSPYNKASYVFYYNDHAANSIIDWNSTLANPTGKRVCFGAGVLEPYRTSSVNVRYFYVPKGTKYVLMQGSIGGGNSFYNASGTVKNFNQQDLNGIPIPLSSPAPSGPIQTVTATCQIIIPVGNTTNVGGQFVPTGTGLDDDQIWYVRRFNGGNALNLSNFYLMNIPGYVARNSDELLIPKDAYDNLLCPNPAFTAGTAGGFGYPLHGRVHLYVWADASGNLPTLTLTSTNKVVTWHLFREKDDTQVMTPGNPTVPLYRLNTGTVATTTTANLNLNTGVGGGCYHFIYNDNQNSTTYISWPAGAKVVMAATEKEPIVSTSSNTWRYFYVPKGTQFIQIHADYIIAGVKFYNEAGAQRNFNQGTSANISQTVAAANTDITIPVPTNEDGKVWSVKSLNAANFYFRNIPGFVAQNRNELMVPQWVNNQLLNLW